LKKELMNLFNLDREFSDKDTMLKNKRSNLGVLTSLCKCTKDETKQHIPWNEAQTKMKINTILNRKKNRNFHSKDSHEGTLTLKIEI
jgi:hypothetical protein